MTFDRPSPLFAGCAQPAHRLALLACAVLVLASLAACSPSAGQGGPGGASGPGGMPAPEVAVLTVTAQAQPVEMEYTGQTAGSRETEVRARVAGILQKRVYTEGSAVKAGAVLFQIDPANFQTQVASTEAAVAVAQAKLNQAQRDQARLAPLVVEKAISQKEFDDSKSAFESAEASLKQMQAQAREARLNLGYASVVAPISGTTGTASKSDGSLVTAGDSLLTTIVQTNPMYVNFSVSEADLLRLTAQMKSGQLSVPGAAAGTRAAGTARSGSLGFSVGLKLADGSLFAQKGKLNFVSEKVNPNTGSFDVRAEVPNPDGSLRPGQFVRVLLGGASRANTLAVPQRAVIDSPFGKMVFVVNKDDKLEPRPVQLDGWTQGNWIVTKGVQSGERVLVDGFIKAHDPGMTVKPVPYVPGTAPSAMPPAPSEGKSPAAPANSASTATK